MDSTYELPACGPRRGQRYLDAQGRFWSVQQVNTLGAGDYSVLRVDVRGPRGHGSTFCLTSQEFLRLAASGELKMVRA